MAVAWTTALTLTDMLALQVCVEMWETLEEGCKAAKEYRASAQASPPPATTQPSQAPAPPPATSSPPTTSPAPQPQALSDGTFDLLGLGDSLSAPSPPDSSLPTQPTTDTSNPLDALAGLSLQSNPAPAR